MENIASCSKELIKIAYEALNEKKGEDIKIIDISALTVVADYFIIANGSNDSHVNALVENVEEQLAKHGCHAKTREGTVRGGWVLIDFGDIIVHIFDKENRLFYDLERIWRDGQAIDPETL